MPSVLDQQFKISVEVPYMQGKAVQQYLEDNVGGRTYYLHSRIGGKRWAIEQNPYHNTVLVRLDDEYLASYIALKFS